MTTAIYPSQKFRFLKSLICVTLVTFFCALTAKAQLQNIPITGFNNDVVANGVGVTNTVSSGTIPGVTQPTIGVDGNGPTAYTFIDNTYKWYSGSTLPTCGMPSSNQITSLQTAGLTYNLQSYSANNVLTVTSNTYSGSVFPTSGSLFLNTPASYGKLFVLYESVLNTSGPSVTATVKFTDSSTQVFSPINVVNWFTNTNAAYTNMQRAQNSAPGAPSGCGSGPYLFEMQLAISPSNYSKTVAYVSFNWSAPTGSAVNTVDYLHVLAIGGLPVCSVPTAQFTSPSFPSVATGSISGSFTAAAGAPNGYLVVRYPTGAATSIPVDGTTYTAGQSLGLGTIVQSSAATTFNALGLNGSTTYDFYVYSYNGSATCSGPIYLTTSAFFGTQTTNPCGVTISGTIPIGAGLPNTPAGGYTSITNALTDINAGGLAGATILELDPSYTTAYAAANETYPINFQGNPCISAINNLTIRPSAGVASVINLTSAIATSTINFNGGSNIIIDGRPGGTGTTSMLSIANTNLGASPAILFNNDASNDVVKYCTIQSVNNSTTSGTIVFGTSTGITGNDNNTIDNCTIIDGATTPVYGIYSSGSSAVVDNSGNMVTNCNIANYYAAASISGGIVLTATGNSGWTISNNKFYQSATRLYTSSQALLSAITVSGGSGYTINGNTIGYADAAGNGTTNMIGNTVALAGFPTSYVTSGTANATRYIGINCAFTAGGTVSNIQGNTINGLALYTSSGATTTYGILCGIQVTSGNVNIGTTTGNTIGSTSATPGSMYAATTTTGGFVVGIYANSANNVTIQNNTIGSIDASGTTATLNGGIAGIDVAGAGTFVVSNNTVGNANAGNMRTGNIRNGANLGAGGTTLTSTTGATGAMVGIRSSVTGSTLNITNNTIQGFTTSGTVSTFTGITSTGNVTSSLAINNNFLGTASAGLVNYTVANSGAFLGINCTGASSATLHSIQNNDIRGITNSVAGTQAQTYLTLTGATAANDVATIASNTFTNLNVNTTGAIIFINQGYSIATTGQLIINNNSIVTGFNRASAGAVTITTTNSTSGTGSIQNITNNNFSNITVTGSSAMLGFNNTDGGTGSTKQITGNTFNNWTGTTGTINCMNFTYLNGVSNISNNTITNIAGQSSIVGITVGATANNANPLNIANNIINNLISTGTGGAVTGITCTNTSSVININNNTVNTFSSTGASAVTGISIGGATNTSVFKNKIYDLSGSNASSTVNGILVSAGALINVHNNTIGDLRTTAANAANPLVGLNFTGGTTINAYYNTVRLAGTSSGALFGSSALSASTTPNLTLRNNILINNSVFSGAGLAVAYRRSTATLTTYNALSNNNILYAGTPSANNLIYADGTNSDQNVVAYKSRVAPVDALSGSENVAFLSTTGSSANFLHVDGTVASISESGAVNIATITDDFDGHIRFGNVGFPGGTAGFPTGGTAPDAGADEYDGIAVGALAAPINFASNTSTTTSFNITWDDNSVGEATFVISRSLNPGGPFAVVGYVTSTSSASTGTGYSVAQTGLLGNTTYYYQITASNVTTSAALIGNATTLPCGGGLNGTYLIPGAYSSITAAITDLQALGMAAPVILELDPTYTGAGESYPLVFGNSIGCLGSLNTLTVRPASTVVTPLTISSASAVTTIDINGGNFVTIDGRPGGTGSANMLNIINTNAAGVAVRITNDASNNTITYCDVQGQNTVAVPTITTAGGVIFINSANATNLQGNDNNTISYCNIHGTGAVTANFPAIGIASFGTATTTNSYNDNCTVSNCNIYDYYHLTAASTGIKLDAGNTAWTLNNNHFYQTTGLNITTSTATHRAIWVTPNTGSISNAANGFVINNNYIGGNNASGTGNYVMTGTAAFTLMGMDLSVGLGAATSVQNNIITNLNITGGFTGNSVYGINIANGNANVGTVAGNLIGSTSTNGAITVTTTVNGGSMIGLRSGAGGTINFSNNIVSGIDMIGNSAAIATGFNGIAGSGGTTINIDNNTIGSSSLVNSINMQSTSATSTTAAAVRGIICNSSAVPTTSTITNNLIANINSNYSASGAQATTLVGIVVTTGASTVTGNTIRNLTSFTQTTAGGSTAGVMGISYTSPTAPALISGNTIHTLTSTHATTTSGPVVAGLFYGGASGTTNLIAKNSIHSLSIVSNTVSSAAAITGMDIASGQLTIQNNMIRLGYDENGNSVTCPTLVRGITKNAAIANVYYNSIYIGGSNVLSTPAANTYAFIRTAAATSDDIRNNIFVNNRSNATTGGKHYQINLSSTSTLNLNFNDYYGNGNGSVFGFNGTSDVTGYTLGWVTGDLNSQVGDPQFMNPTGSATTGDLHINPSVQTVIEQNGINIATVSDDFDSQTRASFSPEDLGADAGNFTPINPCTGTPPASVATLTNTSIMCVSGSKVIYLAGGFVSQPGYTYQWQESATGLAGSFVNVTTGAGGNTNTFTTAVLSSSMYYQCIVACINGGVSTTSSSVLVQVNPLPTLTVTPATGTAVCSGSNVDLIASGAATYSWSANPGVSGYPQVSLFSTPNNLAKVTSRPSSTLTATPNVINPPFPTVSTPTWTYTVTGTDAAGCVSTSTVVLNVTTAASIPLTLITSYTPDPICTPGTPITFTANNSGTIGSGSWVYNWYDSLGTTLLQTTTNTAASDSYTPAAPTSNGNKVYTVRVSNTVCPSSYAIASPSAFVGFTSLIVPTNPNCGDNGIISVYPEGQTDFTDWYVNNFTTGLLGAAFDAGYGNVNFTGGICNLTPLTATGQNGALLIRNAGSVNTNNLQVDFKLTTAPLGFNFNILGADGMAWSYAPDVVQGTITPAAGGFNAECGSGSGFKLAFDATANGAINTPGCYLMYNCTTPDQGPSSPGVIAFKQGSFWQGLTGAPVRILISENGYVTVTLNNQVIFDHVALPTAYLTSNKSTWIHSFTARTGGSTELHSIDDLSIRYNAYEYSINSTNGSDGSWQTENVFPSLAAASYPVWVRKLNDPSCFSNTGTAVLSVDPSPSSANTVPASGYSSVVCYGSGTTLTSSVFVPGAIFYWEQASSLGGPWTAAIGTNSDASYITPGLTSNTYYRLTFTCPSSTPIVATPLLVTVNAGTIASTNSPQLVNCLGDNVTLTATPGANTTCVWYASATGGSPLITGNTYTVTPTSLPTTYYVEPVTTIYSNHYFNGGQTVISNSPGTPGSGVSISTRFTTTASIIIDSIKVLPGATGTLVIALQAGGSAANISTFNFNVTAAMVGNFVNVPLNLTVPGSGNYQLTTTGVACSYYSSYTSSYSASYMSLGGVFTITGGATSPTGALSTAVYGTAFRWAISSSCPAGNGARVPVIVQANPATAVNVSVSAASTCAGTIQSLTASSLASYTNYTWTPITDLYIDAAATIPYPAGNNSTTVYMKSSTGGNKTYTVSTAGSLSGCTNTASGTISVIAAPTVLVSASPSSVCQGSNSQLNVSTSGAYCIPTYSTGTTAGDYCTLVSLGSTTLNNATGASGTPYYNLYPTSGNTTATLTAGTTYTLTLVAGTFSSNDFAAWIDYNHNGDLATSGEKLGEVDNIGATPASTTIVFTVPVSAYNGLTRFRVREADQASTGGMDPCAAYSFGETEDYMVNIIGGVTPSGFSYDWSANATYLSATNIGNPIAQAMMGSQTYTVTVTDLATGCTNTGTTAVTVNLPTSSNNSATGCNLFIWNGTTYTVSGVYTHTALNAAGCDSTATLNLTILHSTASTTPVTACGSYVWHGNTYTATGLYTFTSTNAAGCDSVETLNLTMACNSILNLTCFIEGYWDGTSGLVPVLANQGETSSATACDSIDVELHSATSPYGMVTSVHTLLNQDGTANCVFGPVSGSYYIVVKNRSMVQAWSAAPVAISSTPSSYNFTTAESQAYGAGGFPTAMKEVAPGVWAFYTGDIVVDENVDLLDLGLLETDISDFAFGYQYLPSNINYPGIISTDLNGDGNVDLLDSPIMEDNISNFIFANHP